MQRKVVKRLFIKLLCESPIKQFTFSVASNRIVFSRVY